MPVIDVAMPTWESGAVLEETLTHLKVSEATGDIDISRLILVDNESGDGTVEVARTVAADAGWTFEPIVEAHPLPVARERAIEAVTAEWFLFLDDDVHISETYLDDLFGAVAPLVGAVQGRKATREEHPSDWTRRRARRGTTHATLLRQEAVTGVQLPPDLHVLEDEYLRRHVETEGYLWVFNHRARFEHASQKRHPIGWQEGYLGGKYGLSTFRDVALNVPYAVLTGRNPLPHAKRTAGWITGWLTRK